MARKKVLKHLAILMFFIFLLSILDAKLYWASLFPYFDIITHTLGGFWVGVFFFYFFLRLKPDISPKHLFLASLSATFLVGVVWEFYELFLDSVVTYNYFSGDGVSDVFFDLLGFAISYIYHLRVIVPLFK